MWGYNTGIMRGYNTKHLKKCGNDFYKTKHSKILQEAIFADLSFIRPSTKKWGGNDFDNTKHLKLRIFLRI